MINGWIKKLARNRGSCCFNWGICIIYYSKVHVRTLKTRRSLRKGDDLGEDSDVSRVSMYLFLLLLYFCRVVMFPGARSWIEYAKHARDVAYARGGVWITFGMLRLGFKPLEGKREQNRLVEKGRVTCAAWELFFLWFTRILYLIRTPRSNNFGAQPIFATNSENFQEESSQFSKLRDLERITFKLFSNNFNFVFLRLNKSKNEFLKIPTRNKILIKRKR